MIAEIQQRDHNQDDTEELQNYTTTNVGRADRGSNGNHDQPGAKAAE